MLSGKRQTGEDAECEVVGGNSARNCYACDTFPDTKSHAEKHKKVVIRHPPRKPLDSMEIKVATTGFASTLSLEHAVPMGELTQQLRSRGKQSVVVHAMSHAPKAAEHMLISEAIVLEHFEASFMMPCTLVFRGGSVLTC